MTFDAALIGAAIHLLFWEKLPHWGTWFNRLIEALPAPLRVLYKQWNCPYCAGFWIALCLHGATGLSTLPSLDDMPAYWAGFGEPLGWLLDALATATLIQLIVLLVNAIRLPAMKSVMLRDEFMKRQSN
ncbi:hypothetical protein [Stappia sp.]|jgi:hypothetical protein|uniref:hypothetical protein n=1 Tax=Stappia sp. TaxID=1870903 RepID=UPI003A9A3D93